MARPAPRSGNQRTDWYVEITNQVVQAMEEAQANGDAWKKCWEGVWKSGVPRNGKSGRHYNGLNVWLLAMQGYSDPRWFTFKQAKEMGEDACVRKGEKGTKVFFWNFLRVYVDHRNEVCKPSKGQIASGAVKCARTIPMLKVYTVFNAEQVDGLPAMDIPNEDPGEKHLQAEALMHILGVDINHVPGTNTACYRPGADRITLPAPGQFDSVEHYWATAFHEVVHWTANKSRCGRDLSGRFGSDAYAMEELVAELGSVFLCAHLGIEGELRHPQYLASWAHRLHEDKYAIFKAASMAQKAVDFILSGGVIEDSEEGEGSEVARAA